MKLLKFLLVCEGPTDIVVIEEITTALSAKLNCNIEVKPLSPQKDATSGQYPPHGWTSIRTWCRTYRHKSEKDLMMVDPKLRPLLKLKSWRGLLAFNGAAGIIFQMDTDICEDITDIEPVFASSGITRKQFGEVALNSWLAENRRPENCYYILSTYSTETWILAVHDKDHPVFADLAPEFCYESLSNVEERLLKLGYRSKVKNGKRRLHKHPPFYESYAQSIVEKLETVRSRCDEANSFCRYIEQFKVVE